MRVYADLVDYKVADGNQVHTVTRDKDCSCGLLNCKHVLAVAEYLAGGGNRPAGDGVFRYANGSADVVDGDTVHHVQPDGMCSCGLPNCKHTRVVREMEERKFISPSAWQVMGDGTCPICGAKINPAPYGWKCESNLGHYWMYRGELQGVKEVLTNPHHKSKLGNAFYEMTPSELNEFRSGLAPVRR